MCECQAAEETDPSCIIVIILRVIYEYPVKLLRATQHLSPSAKKGENKKDSDHVSTPDMESVIGASIVVQVQASPTTLQW